MALGFEASLGSGGAWGRRTLTALTLAIIALLALFSANPLPVALLGVVVVLAGFREYARLTSLNIHVWGGLAVAAVSAGLVVAIGSNESPSSNGFLVASWAGLAVGFVGLSDWLRWKPRSWLAPFGAAWLATPVATAIVVQQRTPISAAPLVANAALMLLVPIWLGDTAALVVGRKFGRHQLAPNVSPGKTWEGAVANLLASMAAALLLGFALGVNMGTSLATGALAGLLGQVGDLVQSLLKRAAGRKDSGGSLPGHGGVLDRIDSFLFACIPCATALLIGAPGLFHVKP